MSWFDNLNLRAKLFLSFGASGAILVAAILYCLLEIRAVKQDVDELTGNTVPSLRVVGEISQLRLRYRVRSLEYMMASPEEQQKMLASMADLDDKLQDALKRYGPLAGTPAEKETLAQAVQAATDYRATVGEAVKLVQAGKADEAQGLRRTKWVQIANGFRDLTDKLATINTENAAAVSKEASAAVDHATVGGLVALVGGTVAAVVIALMVAALISKRLTAAVAMAQRIAGGDLQETSAVPGSDEIGKLVVAMQQMRNALHGAISRIYTGAETVATASHQLAATSTSMKQSTDVQSESAAAIAANIEELTVSINQMADITRDCAHLAGESDSQAQRGKETTEQLVVQMGQVAKVVDGTAQQIAMLENESEKISQIVSVIKGIADQTNLLALNAAIEAARAGDQGRGFAVVADEVRTLSERTAKSTQEISDTVSAIREAIRAVVAEVGEGVTLSGEGVSKARTAGDAIGQMREIVRQVAEMVGSIDAALREQSSAATDIAQKVEKISLQAQETSNAGTETSAAAEELDNIAHEMQAAVSGFRI